jgi:valyl-tRNA synthetase
VLAAVRGAKSTAKVSMRTEVPRVVVRAPAEVAERVAQVSDDVRASGRVLALVVEPGDELAVEVTL